MKFIKEFIKNNKEVNYILYFPIYIMAFFLIEYITPTSGYWVTDCVLDNYIPFVPEFIFSYVLWFPLFPLIGFPLLFKDVDALSRWMRFIIFSTSSCLIFYYFVPNGQDLRPVGLVPDSVATEFLTLIWSVDTSTNVFPSMHVVTCIGNICAVLDSKTTFKNKFYKFFLVIATVLCASSTVLIKQHGIMDIFGAVTLAVPLIIIIYGKRIMGEKKNRPPVLPSRLVRSEDLS